MKEIKDRQDISLLVNTFYDSIRKDELLGPIFNRHISEDQWPAHLEKLTDFWVTALFGQACFKGNPTLKHRMVDKNLKYSIAPSHFAQWVTLWHKTIDELFQGEIANRAKNASENMAVAQFHAIRSYRMTEHD
ncbi:group III truncated hemoglobin [Membranihabitans marinus]|uniref:group III truncated hemoglobin n=1 Tax=Membranihabitans marinus TaxID=1227546 RepID=UPI001F2162ED|nr:group III truncated hemoglobin [Membranihabitans marinus]